MINSLHKIVGNILTPITELWDWNIKTGKYFYNAANATSDGIGDFRSYVLPGGSYITQRCTVANATKGAGTWVTDMSITNTGVVTIPQLSHPITKTVTVAATGGDYTTIQAALTANVTEGLTVLVYPGTYTNDTINFTANNQTIFGVGTPTSNTLPATNQTILNVSTYTGCVVYNMTLAQLISDGVVRDNITVTTGTVTFINCIVSSVINTINIATARQPAIGYIVNDGEIYFHENCIINYDNESDDAGALAIKVPFVFERDGYVVGKDSSISFDSTNAANAIVVTAMASYIATDGLYGDMRFTNCNIDVDDDRALVVAGSGYIITGTPAEEYRNCNFTIRRGAVAGGIVSVLYASGAGAARILSYDNEIDVVNLGTPANAWAYYQAGIPTITVYNDNIEYAAGGESGTITRMATTHSLINHVIGNYIYHSANIIGDTVNDRREINTAGVMTYQRCTVANAVKGAGTWVTDTSITTTGELQVTTTGKIITSLTTPLVIGGTETTSDLTFKTTTAAGAAGADMHFLVGNNGGTEAMTILNSGSVGIGMTSPSNVLDVSGAATTAITNCPFLGNYVSSNNYASGMGGGITFGGKYSDAGTTAFGYIAGVKENATNGNYDGKLIFGTRINGGGAADMTRMTLTSTGFLGIGTTTPSYNVSLLGTLGKTIGMENAPAAAAGNSLTIHSGGVTSGNNLSAGSLINQTGRTTGTGTADFSVETTTGGATGGTATTVYNPAEKYRVLSRQLIDNNMQYTGAVPNTAGSFYQLTASKAGIGILSWGDGTEYAMFAFTTAGVVTLINISANVVNAQTNDRINIIDGGTSVYIINEMGATATMTITIIYNQ